MTARPSADVVVAHCGELATLSRGTVPRTGAALNDAGVIPDGAVAIAGDRIIAVGPTEALLQQVRTTPSTTVLDAAGRLVTPGLVDSHTHLSGLPAFLTTRSGLHSGYMLAQYTAAALVSENKVLAHPASVDSIPTSANQEDHVSMGTIAARKARQVVANAQRVAGIELLCASQALDLRGGRYGPGTEAARRTVRARVPRLEEDRCVADDLRAVDALVRDETLVQAVEAAAGTLA